MESIGFGFCTAHLFCAQSNVSTHLPSIWFDSNCPDQIVERLTEPIGSLQSKGDSSRLEIDSTSFLQSTQNSFHEAVKENVNESIQLNRSTHFFCS